MIGCGWRVVRVLGLWVGIGQNGIWPGISQNTRILCWSWSKGSDSAGHWSEHSDFGLVLAKAIRFGWALVRTFGFWAGVGQSDQIWLGIGQSTRILGWSWSKGSDLTGHLSEKSDFRLGLVKIVGFGRALVRTFGFWAGVG